MKIFDKAWVISLDCPTGKRRLKRFHKSLKDHGWPYEVPQTFKAINGEALPMPCGYTRTTGTEDGEEVVHWQRQQWDGYTEGGGAWGCARSHVRLIEDFLQEISGTKGADKKAILLMEDDAVLVDGFADKLAKFLKHLPKDWEGVYLGGQHFVAPKKVSNGVVRCQEVGRTHCYIARGNYLRALYRHWAMCPVHIDWIQEQLVKQFPVYAPEEFLVVQGSGKSFISGRTNPTMSWNHKEPDCIVVLRADKAVMDELRDHGWHNGYWRDGNTGIDNGITDLLAANDPEVLFRKLKSLLSIYRQEGANIQGGVPVVWHPSIPAQWVMMSSDIPVLEIQNPKTPEQAIKALEQWRKSATAGQLPSVAA